MIQSFDAFLVRQKETTFWSTVFAAEDVLPLCGGLRRSDAQERPFDEFSTNSDAKKLVDALESSQFVQEVTRIQTATYEKEDPFQRIYEEVRGREIATYLREPDALLPNAVILGTRDDVEVTAEQKNGFSRITLEWDADRPFNVIDGQHRLEAVRLLVETGHSEFKDFCIPAMVLVNQPFYVQAELFAVVNGKQKPVNRSRIYDLLGYMPVTDASLRERAYRGEMAVHRFSHHAVKVLNSYEKSPWFRRIKMRGSGEGIVSQAAFVDHLAPLVMSRKERPGLRLFPLLFTYFRDNNLVALTKILFRYFEGIRQAQPEFWSSDENLKASLFGKTNGVAVMFMVLHDLLLLGKETGTLTLDEAESFWRKAPKQRIAQPPKAGSKAFQVEIHDALMRSAFGPNYRETVTARMDSAIALLKNQKALI